MRLPWSLRVNSSNQSLFDVRTDERNSRIEIRFIGESEISARAKIYFGQLDNARDSSFQSIFNSTPILYTYICSHWDIRTCYEKRTRFSIDRRYPPFDVSFFGGRKEFKRRGDLAKAIRIKKRGKEKMKSGKERGRQRLFHHDRHVFPSSTNYDLFEFVRVLRVSSIFLPRYSYTRFQSTRLNYAHVRQRNQDK